MPPRVDTAAIVPTQIITYRGVAMKYAMLSLILLAVNVSAATDPYTLVLVTQGKHFERQLGTYESVRECATEGAEMIFDHELYIGFACVLTEEIEHYTKGESKHDPES
jgi:hypothetical protein